MIDYRELHLSGGAVQSLPQDVRTYVFGSTNADNLTAEFEWDISKLPRKVDLRDAKIQNQGGYQSCVGQSISGAAEIELGARDKFVELSPLFLYWNSRKLLSELTHTPIRDVGTSIFTALGVATKMGVCAELLHPEGTDPMQEPSALAYADGLTRKIGRYEAIGVEKYKRNRKNDVLVALACGMPVVFAFPLREAFYNIVGPLDTHQAQYPRTNVAINDPESVGNHAMQIVGYDLDKDYMIVENSWGDEWGDKGYWAMPFIALYNCFDCFAIREFAGERFEIPEELRIRKNPIESNYGKAYRLYRAAFGRAPDKAGLAYWTGVLDNGATLIDVAGGFINSQEFVDFYGATPSNSSFANSLYLNVLHREPDPAGLAYWVNRLDDGAAKAEVLVAVSESAENKLGATW
jgi:hypothetical protein